MSIDLLQADYLVDKFLEERKLGISSLHRYYFKTNNNLSLQSLISELKDELKTGCITFYNKQYPPEELNSYLFYIANIFCKSHAFFPSIKKTEFICPACSFLKKEHKIIYYNIFECTECEAAYQSAIDPKIKAFFNTFKKHNKKGFKCPECKRFIPKPLIPSNIITCPYLDCVFVGKDDVLQKMQHPKIKSKIDNLNIDNMALSLKENIISNLEIKENFINHIKIIKDVIKQQTNNISYNSSSFTIKHKQLVYLAIEKLLDHYPQEMVDYLINNSRSGGFQHKIFQEYISYLDNSLPLILTKNKVPYKISSLGDPNLGLFNGISVFEAVVLENLEIKNNTKEFYIGNRKGSYAKPYYIGKLLSILDKKDKTPLIENVVEYSFNKIKMKNVVPGTIVIITHLRVPPHYQMGGMVYVNRVRKKIVDRLRVIMNK